jgi:hypothetical protein
LAELGEFRLDLGHRHRALLLAEHVLGIALDGLAADLDSDAARPEFGMDGVEVVGLADVVTDIRRRNSGVSPGRDR